LGFFLDNRDANNLLTMLWTWQHADVGQSPGFGGDTAAAPTRPTPRSSTRP
jgi:homoserine O-acetyltransferase